MRVNAEDWMRNENMHRVEYQLQFQPTTVGTRSGRVEAVAQMPTCRLMVRYSIHSEILYCSVQNTYNTVLYKHICNGRRLDSQGCRRWCR